MTTICGHWNLTSNRSPSAKAHGLCIYSVQPPGKAPLGKALNAQATAEAVFYFRSFISFNWKGSKNQTLLSGSLFLSLSFLDGFGWPQWTKALYYRTNLGTNVYNAYGYLYTLTLNGTDLCGTQCVRFKLCLPLSSPTVQVHCSRFAAFTGAGSAWTRPRRVLKE